ncbi:MAG TPA: ATP-binding protein [Steroidobacteraceae bacterium]|jgi:nitrogen fixation/metabolism regulation signal transduction histidine kinase|nr:ATP-binding protein [Steroidobacteraceae bacterium]
MTSSPFRTGVAVRAAALFLTVGAVAWMIANTQWYVTIALFIVAALAEAAALVRFSSQSSREVARFLDALSVDDLSQSFSGLTADGAHRELGSAMERVLARLRASRSERDEQAQYLQTLVNHVPVALISLDERSAVKMLNMAARRLFESSLTQAAQLSRYGESFAVSLESLSAGNTAILRMERSSGALLLKAAATEIVTRGLRTRLISLQNIENEMSAQELEAWQTVIRVMAHEVMNSLTPLSSLAATAHDLVRDVLGQLPADDPRAAALVDADDALEAVSRRSEGLLHFVRSHRRLTKPLAARMEVMPVQRLFARIQRLLASDLADRDIRMGVSVEPETLELAMDAELLDQALINLVRNAIEALRDTPSGHIALSAYRTQDGRIAISVSDNGPGIAPDQREKVFVPFFTTKRQGSGIGLTLVRQIAAAHSANVDVTETAGGGATVLLRF